MADHLPSCFKYRQLNFYGQIFKSDFPAFSPARYPPFKIMLYIAPQNEGTSV